MSFQLTELILEATIRDGLQAIKSSINSPTLDIIDDIFGSLKEVWLQTYFGQNEINKIKNFLNTQTINIVQGFALADIKPPLIAINLNNNREAEEYEVFEDFKEEVDTDILPQVIKASFNAVSYDPSTGLIDVTGVLSDLNGVYNNTFFIDGNANQYSIVGGITDTPTDKHFLINPNITSINLTNCTIVSNVSISRVKIRATRDFEEIMLSIVTEEALLTKYLYTIIKYILLAYKKTLISRGLELTTYTGSDFNRQDRLPENLFVRNLMLRINFVEHSWTGENLPILGAINDTLCVPRDLYPREDETTLTIQSCTDC